MLLLLHLVYNPFEVRVFLLEQFGRAVEFDDLSVTEHHYSIALQNCLDPVRDDKHRRVLEPQVHGLLNLLFGVRVDIGRSFVQDDQLPPSKHGPREADDLLFSLTEVASIVLNAHVQALLLVFLVIELKQIERFHHLHVELLS